MILEVDDRFSTYAMCNIGQNGTDGHRNKCTDGTYCCFCDAPTHPYGPPIPCNLTVGRENVYDHFGHKFKQCSGPDATVAECYRSNVVQKLDAAHPGYWYSPLEKGYCGDGDGDGDGSVPHSIGSDCTWRVVSVEKVVSRECHSKTFGDAVQASAPPACLAACGDQKTNISSPCWVDCFYQAALGTRVTTHTHIHTRTHARTHACTHAPFFFVVRSCISRSDLVHCLHFYADVHSYNSNSNSNSKSDDVAVSQRPWCSQTKR